MSGGHGGGSGRITTILKVVLVVFVIGLVIFWIVTGGPQRAWQAGKNFTNPIAVIFGYGTTTGIGITLPWQPEMTRGPDISDYVGVADQQLQDGDTQQSQQQPVSDDTARLQQFGNPSPYQGEVTIANNAASTDATHEYIELQASEDNSGPVDISGWTLQSAVSGHAGTIPLAAPTFAGGSINSVQAVYLAPSATAIVTSAVSPVGVSFEENECSGYLDQTQTFYPTLSNSCPSPSDALPQTADNLRVYGASCFDYITDLPSCYFPGTSLPSNLSSACRSYLATTLSYNGCVAQYHTHPEFPLPSWRLYLGFRTSLWNQSHDVIRLLDSNGRIVDVLSY